MRRAILFLILLLFTTGCTNIDTTLNINSDKSASVVSKLFYDKDLSDKTDKSAYIILNNYKKFLDDDYSVRDENNMIMASKAVGNIIDNDIDLGSLGFAPNSKSGRYVEVNHNFFVTSYNIDIIYDYRLQPSKIDYSFAPFKKGLKPEYLQEYADRSEIITNNSVDDTNLFEENFDDNFGELSSTKNVSQKKSNKSPNSKDNDVSMTFSVRVPAFASFNNADYAEGFIYTWNIRKDSPTVIKLQYVEYSTFAILLMLLIGISFLVYFAHRILRHDAEKRIGSNN